MIGPSAAEMEVQEDRRRPELDGLRGLAILLVIYQHYVNGPFGPAAGSVFGYILLPGRLSWTGVDLFFLLSGYLVGGILIRNRESPAYYKTFYARRAYRILPLYLTCVAVFHLSGSSLLWAASRPPLYLYLTFTQNFWMAAAGTFGGTALAVTWSLAVEEQFYLTAPALVRYVTPQRLWRALAACILLAPLLRLALYLTIAPTFFASYVLPFTRMDTLMLGVLTAWLQQRGFVVPNRLLYAAWFVLGAGMLYTVREDLLTAPGPLVRMFWYNLIALFYLSMLLLAIQGRLRWLRMKWLTYVGFISYGLYLLHQPINALVQGGRINSGRRGAALTVAALAVVFALASFSWEFFEKPLVQLGHGRRYGSEGATHAEPLRAETAEAG